MLHEIKNSLSGLRPWIARALQRPHIVASAEDGVLFLVGPTEDYRLVRVQLRLKLALRNPTPVNTSVTVKSVCFRGLLGKAEHTLASAFIAELGKTLVSTSLDIDGGKTLSAHALLQLLFANHDLPAVGRTVTGEVALSESYGVRIRPVPFQARFSTESPPGTLAWQ